MIEVARGVDMAAWAEMAADGIKSRMSQEVRWQARRTELLVLHAVLEEGAEAGDAPWAAGWSLGTAGITGRKWQVLVTGGGEAVALC